MRWVVDFGEVAEFLEEDVAEAGGDVVATVAVGGDDVCIATLDDVGEV